MQDAGTRAAPDVDAGVEREEHWLGRAVDRLGEGWARIDRTGRIDGTAGPLFQILDSPRPQTGRLREAARALRADAPLSWPPRGGDGWRWTARRQDGRAVALEAHALDDGCWLLRARWMEAPAAAEPASSAGLYHPITRLPQPPLLLDRLQQAVERSRRTVTHRFAVILIGLERPAAGAEPQLKAIARGLEQAVRPADTVAHLDDETLAVIVEPVRGDDNTAQVTIDAVVANLRSAVDQAAGAVPPASAAAFSVALGDGDSHASDLVAFARSRLTRRPAAPAQALTLVAEASLASRRRTALVAETASLPDPQRLLEAIAGPLWAGDAPALVLVLDSIPPLQELQALAAAVGRLQPRPVLTVELDEAAAARDPEAAIQLADAAAARGIRIGLAGYGKGRCPEALLARLRPCRLSLDAALAADARHQIAVRVRLAAAITGAHERGLPVTAPGVDDPAHAALLASLGCDSARGPLFANDPPAEP